MIEWALIASAVTPRIKKYVSDKGEKLAKDYADNKLAQIYRSVFPDEKLTKAIQAFLVRFSKELDSAADLPTVTLPAYQEAVKLLLSDKEVLETLEGPLDGQSELDWELLSSRWRYLRTSSGEALIELPEDFDWSRLSKRYCEAVRKQTLSDPVLRQVAQATASLQIAKATERIAGPIKSFDLARYAQSIKESYGYLKLGSLDAEWTAYENRIRLENVYVPQSAKQALPARDLTRDYRRELQERGIRIDEERFQKEKQGYEDLKAIQIMEIVDASLNSRLVVLGDPGLGKSTLLKHLALRWAENPGKPLALLVELRRTVKESGDIDFFDYLERGAGNTLPLPRLELSEYLRGHECLVLFDALDEVAEAYRGNVVSHIISFAREFPRARLIVTTRIHGYYPGSPYPEHFRDSEFKQFTLQDFSDEETDLFIGTWHQEAFHNSADRSTFEARLRNAIRGSAAIHELAANPLLLTLMAVLSRVQDLPRDRARLYERCAELLLKNWDLEKFPERKERKDVRDIKDKLGPEQKMRILELVAAAMQAERAGLAGNMIHEDKLKPIIQAQLEELGVQQPWSVAEDLIWLLRERNFMLAYLGDHQYAFVHRTFLEYFTARDLRYRLEKTSTFTVEQLGSFLVEHWSQDEWREVLFLLSGLIGPKHAADCISQLLAAYEISHGHNLLFFAARCLQEIRELGIIRDVRQRTFKALRDCATDNSEESVRWRAIAQLAQGWKDAPGMLEWLKDRALNDPGESVRGAAIEQLAQGWKDAPGMLEWLKDRALNDPSDYVRGTAIAQLAQGWKDASGMLEWLKDRALNDPGKSVRWTAIELLTQGWNDAPGMLEWLKDRALNDPGESVRWTAIARLAQGWKDAPGMLEWLKERALNDPGEYVRWTAIAQLAQGWKDAPGMLEWLKERALNDPDAYVRWTAIELLTQGWKDAPGILEWLKDNALNNPGESVRRSAIVQLAQRWKDAPGMLEWLRDRALRDPGQYVRGTAIAQLAQGWKDAPGMLEWIKHRALNDSNEHVRRTAIAQLAQGWKDAPGMLEWIKHRALNDSNEHVRRTAVDELAQSWKDTPDMLEWIKERALNDSHEYVRGTAIEQLAQGWKDAPGMLEWLKERALNDPSGSVRQAASGV